MTVREAGSSPLERAEVWAASAGAMAGALTRSERTHRIEECDVPRSDRDRIALLLRRAGTTGASPNDRAARAVVRKTLTRVLGPRSFTDDEVAHHAQALARTLGIVGRVFHDDAPEMPDGGRYTMLTDDEREHVHALLRFLEQLARDGTRAATAPRYPMVRGRMAGSSRSGFRGAD